MLRNAVNWSAPRNPQGPSTGRRIGSTGVPRRLATRSWIECAVDRFPFPQRERLRPARGVDADGVQPPPRFGPGYARDAREGPAELLAPELEHRLDHAQEVADVGHINRRALADGEHDEPGVDARR